MILMLIALYGCAPSDPLKAILVADLEKWDGDTNLWEAVRALPVEDQQVIGRYMQAEGLKRGVREDITLGELLRVQKIMHPEGESPFSTLPEIVAERIAKDVALREQVTTGSMEPVASFVAEEERNNPGMVFISGGPFIKGRMNLDPWAYPAEPKPQIVSIASFLIDRFEYPNQVGHQPMHGMNVDTAERLCKEQGKRLCTSDEWEKSCKGPMNNIYPTDTDMFITQLGSVCLNRDSNSGADPDCKNLYGVHDLATNYPEWTSATVLENGLTRQIQKGRDWSRPMAPKETSERCAWQQVTDGSLFVSDNISFRCCRDTGLGPLPTVVNAAP